QGREGQVRPARPRRRAVRGPPENRRSPPRPPPWGLGSWADNGPTPTLSRDVGHRERNLSALGTVVPRGTRTPDRSGTCSPGRDEESKARWKTRSHHAYPPDVERMGTSGGRWDRSRLAQLQYTKRWGGPEQVTYIELPAPGLRRWWRSRQL